MKKFYVFTPKGDMPDPALMGATAPICLRTSTHELGYRATAIKVNNKLVPMGCKLNNGDQIQITNTKNQKPPTEEWLKMVVTGKKQKSDPLYERGNEKGANMAKKL